LLLHNIRDQLLYATKCDDSIFYASLAIYQSYFSCFISVASLAINRFCSLYFKNVFDSFKKIFVFLCIYDLVVVVYVWVMLNIFDYNSYLEVAFDLIIMIPTILFAILIFIKIQNMKKLSKGSIYEKSTISDLHKAAIVHLVQCMSCSTELFLVVPNHAYCSRKF
jgi:hypothetical protein